MELVKNVKKYLSERLKGEIEALKLKSTLEAYQYELHKTRYRM